MEKCNIDLKTLLRSKKVLTEQEVIPILLDLIEAIKHLALHNYVHCNIKPSNILLATDGSAKLTDFSLAHRLPSSKATF